MWHPLNMRASLLISKPTSVQSMSTVQNNAEVFHFGLRIRMRPKFLQGTVLALF